MRGEYEDAAYVRQYAADVDAIGLWESERVLFRRWLPPRARVLDVGCGAGRAAFGLRALGRYAVTGLEPSAALLAVCLERARGMRDAPRFVGGDIRRAPFPDGSFDACLFTFNGLFTIPGHTERRAALVGIARLLVPGGVFLFSAPLLDPDEYRAYWRRERLAGRPPAEYGDLEVEEVPGSPATGFLHLPQPGEIAADLAEAGFRVLFRAPRDAVAEERPDVMERTGDAELWVAEKP